MSKLAFSGSVLNEKGYKVLNDIEGVIYKSVDITSTGTTIEHNLGRVPYFVVLTPRGNAIVWLESEDRNKIVIRSSVDCYCDIMIL